jgi:hypothetical protein
VYTTPVAPTQTVLEEVVNAAGCDPGPAVIFNDLGELSPHPLCAMTERIPDVAEAVKLIVTEFPVPFIVAPVPE